MQNSAKITHERNLNKKKIIKNDIIDWVLNNENTVLECPYNNIEKHYTNLKICYLRNTVLKI